MSEPVSTSAEAAEQPALIATPRPPTRVQRVRALRGKYAFVRFTSEDHARDKLEEVQREK